MNNEYLFFSCSLTLITFLCLHTILQKVVDICVYDDCIIGVIFFTLIFFHNVSMDFKLNNFQSLNKITLIYFSFVNVFILLPNAKMIFSYINPFKIKSFNSDSLIHVKLWLDSFILYTRDICHISAATGNKSDTLDEKLLITFVLLWFIEFFSLFFFKWNK